MAKEEEKTPKIAKARYWWAVLYQENMRPDWREAIDDLFQLPYAYCEHTADNDGRLVILVVDVAHRREVYKRR